MLFIRTQNVAQSLMFYNRVDTSLIRLQKYYRRFRRKQNNREIARSLMITNIYGNRSILYHSVQSTFYTVIRARAEFVLFHKRNARVVIIELRRRIRYDTICCSCDVYNSLVRPFRGENTRYTNKH